MTTLFLFTSGIGQIVCPIYMSLKTTTKGLAFCTILAMLFYPVSNILKNLAFLGLGFFSRGFFISSLIYINEIGGERFRAWAMIVIFGVWGISTLVSSVEKMLKVAEWIGYYAFIFLPFIIDSYFVFKHW